MAIETADRTDVPTGNAEWRGGVAAGLAGGAVMGVVPSVTMTTVVEVAIPSVYGLRCGPAARFVRVSHAAVPGVAFAATARAAGVHGTGRSTARGVGYGVVLWVVLAVVVMPVWLPAVGSPANPPFPNANRTSLVGHVVSGAVASAVRTRERARRPGGTRPSARTASLTFSPCPTFDLV